MHLLGSVLLPTSVEFTSFTNASTLFSIAVVSPFGATHGDVDASAFENAAVNEDVHFPSFRGSGATFFPAAPASTPSLHAAFLPAAFSFAAVHLLCADAVPTVAVTKARTPSPTVSPLSMSRPLSLFAISFFRTLPSVGCYAPWRFTVKAFFGDFARGN